MEKEIKIRETKDGLIVMSLVLDSGPIYSLLLNSRLRMLSTFKEREKLMGQEIVASDTKENWKKLIINRYSPLYYFEPSNKYFATKEEWVKEWNDAFSGIHVSKDAKVSDWEASHWDKERLNRDDPKILIEIAEEVAEFINSWEN